MAHYFPEEIIYEILLRLPVKSLVRFTCVNKSWCSIIKSPHFVSAHLAHTIRSDSKNSTHLLVLKPSWETHDPTYITSIVPACLVKQAIEQDKYSKSFDEYAELRFPNKSLPPFKVVGSCNGLVLLKCFIDTLILWNPLLRKSLTLPEPHNTDQYDDPDQLRSTGWGFGFDSRTNDCKVVKIVDSLVQVFSLSTGYWKSFKVAAPACRLNHDGGPQPFINGAIHWLASARIGSTGVCQNSISSFDVSNEIFREIVLPERLVPSLTNYCLDPISYSISEYGKSLALGVGATHFLSLWVMKEYGEVESWTEVLNCKTLADIPKPVLGFTRSGKEDYLDIPKPLGFTTNGEVLWEAYTGHVASYDPKSSTFKYHIPEKYGSWGGYHFAGSYVESLVLLNESNQKQEREWPEEQQIKQK